VEYLQVDTRTFTTDEEGALGALFGEGSDEAPNAGAALRRTAARLATVFATMKVRIPLAGPPLHGSHGPGFTVRLAACAQICYCVCHHEGPQAGAGRLQGLISTAALQQAAVCACCASCSFKWLRHRASPGHWLACGAAQPSCQHPQCAAIVRLLLCLLQEMPAIRFRAAKPPDMDADDSPVLEARALVPQRLAIELDAQLQGMQAAGLLPPGAARCAILLERLYQSSNHASWQNA
jgi:hypothetical protein